MARRGRTDRGQWLEAAFALLRDEGERSLTIDRLCALVDRSKGSFYHHFRDHDAFVDALLDRWVEVLTEQPIRVAAAEPDAARRSAALSAVVRGLDHGLDLAIRAWAWRDPRVRAVVQRVDDRRLECLAELHALAGRRDARLLAQIEYACFVGAQALGLVPSAEAERIEAKLLQALALIDAES